MAQPTTFIGIDLGGTKIGTALADTEGRVLARDRRETRAADGPQAVVERMIDAAHRVIGEAGVSLAQVIAVGVAAPGPIDGRAGMVVAPPNLPGWEAVPLRQIIEDALGVTTFLENDANAAALGEHRFGAGRGTQNMIYVTVSTGIGGGFIFNGQLYDGATGAAAEVGHMIILAGGPLCGCGNRGCLEALSSGTAIARVGREVMAQDRSTLIAELANGEPARVSAKLVAQAAAQGDVVAQNILTEAMNYLGLGMANLVNLLNPELLAIGGGLTNLGEGLFEPVRRAIDQHAFRTAAQAVRVAPAELGDEVGVSGAVAVAITRSEV